MLLESPALRPALAPVRLEGAFQRGPNGEARPTDFRLVSVHDGTHWKPVATASRSYRLLDNRSVISALERNAKSVGLSLAPARAFADRGDGGQYVAARFDGTKTRIVLTDESQRFDVRGSGGSS